MLPRTIVEGGEDNLSGDHSSRLSPDPSNVHATALRLQKASKIAYLTRSPRLDLSTTVDTTVYNQRHSRLMQAARPRSNSSPGCQQTTARKSEGRRVSVEHSPPFVSICKESLNGPFV